MAQTREVEFVFETPKEGGRSRLRTRIVELAPAVSLQEASESARQARVLYVERLSEDGRSVDEIGSLPFSGLNSGLNRTPARHAFPG